MTEKEFWDKILSIVPMWQMIEDYISCGDCPFAVECNTKDEKGEKFFCGDVFKEQYLACKDS